MALSLHCSRCVRVAEEAEGGKPPAGTVPLASGCLLSIMPTATPSSSSSRTMGACAQNGFHLMHGHKPHLMLSRQLLRSPFASAWYIEAIREGVTLACYSSQVLMSLSAHSSCANRQGGHIEEASRFARTDMMADAQVKTCAHKT